MKTLLISLALLTGGAGLHAATTIQPTNSFAYGANIGWINWRGDVTSGAVVGEYVCSGSIWSANCGWISLGSGTPVNGIQYGNASATDFGVNLTGHVVSGGVPPAQLRGFAYGANIGWINFESTGNPEISLSTGRLSGFAYSANCGWIDLASATAFVQTDFIIPGADTDGDGIADAHELFTPIPTVSPCSPPPATATAMAKATAKNISRTPIQSTRSRRCASPRLRPTARITSYSTGRAMPRAATASKTKPTSSPRRGR